MQPRIYPKFQAPSAVRTRSPEERLRMSAAEPKGDNSSQQGGTEAGSKKNVLQPLNSAIGPDGFVKYDLLLKDSTVLDQNIEVIKEFSGLEEDEYSKENLAFYCNAYNMWCLYLATDKLRKSKGKWKGNVSFGSRANMFYLSKVVVAGNKMNLMKLENEIIRKFNDARIHCAINCASWSCPRLPQRMYEGSTLDSQFDDRAKKFINRDGGVIVKDDIVYLNQIFKWYRSDFDDHGGGLIPFINKYWQGEPLALDTPLQFQKYDWSLNSSANPKVSR